MFVPICCSRPLECRHWVDNGRLAKAKIGNSLSRFQYPAKTGIAIARLNPTVAQHSSAELTNNAFEVILHLHAKIAGDYELLLRFLGGRTSRQCRW